MTLSVRQARNETLFSEPCKVPARQSVSDGTVCNGATRLARVARLTVSCDSSVFTPPTTVGNERPADEAAARAAITQLYADVFGPSGLSDAERLAKIDDHGGLQTILDKQRADGTAQNATLVNGSIQFISAPGHNSVSRCRPGLIRRSSARQCL